MARCCYCGTLTRKKSGRTFHRFPLKNKKLLAKWLEQLPLKNWTPNKNSIICSDHFAADCLDKSGFRTRLMIDSVPTIFDDSIGICVYCRDNQKPEDKTFFRFPHENKELLEKWVENLNMSGWWPKPKSLLCSRHFDPSTIIRSGKSFKLKPGSAPTLFSSENASKSSNNEKNYENSMNQSEIDENHFDIDNFLNFPNNFDETEDFLDVLHKRDDGGSFFENKIAEYEKNIEEKEKTIELQKVQIKQLQDQISSFKEVIFELCRDKKVSETSLQSGWIVDPEAED